MYRFRYAFAFICLLQLSTTASADPGADLKAALMQCNLTGTEAALAAGATLDSLQTDDLNAVSYTYFCPEVTAFLIAQGVDAKHRGGTYALAAAGNNYSYEVIEILISAGADPNAISPIYSATPVEITLRQSNCVPCLKAMLAGGADFNKRGVNNSTYVQVLSSFSQTAEERKSNFAKGKAGMESYGLHVPDWYGNLGEDRNGSPDDMLMVLAEGGADVNVVDAQGRTPLALALNLQKLALAKVLVKHGAKLDPKDLALAAVFGDAELVIAILDAGADMNVKVAAADLPAQSRLATSGGAVLVAAKDLTPLVIAINNGNVDAAVALIERGAALDIPVSGQIYLPVDAEALASARAKREGRYCPVRIEGKSAIYWAVEQGNLDLVRKIGEKSAWSFATNLEQKQKSLSVDFNAFSGDVLECRDLKNQPLPSEIADYYNYGEIATLLKSHGK